jgi:putative flippase GtrA
MASGLIINTRWTFRQKARPSIGQTVRFILMNLVTLALSTALIGWLTGTLAISKAAAGLIAAAFSAVVNFTGSKLFVFRHYAGDARSDL